MRVIIFLFSLFIFTSAQNDVFETHDIFKIKRTNQVLTSPNGEYTAFTLIVPRPFSDEPGSDYSELHLISVSNNKTIGLIVGKVSVNSLSWGKNSDYIFFRKKDDETKKTQVFKINIDTKEITRITENETSVLQYGLSNDNNFMAFTAEDKVEVDEKLIKMGFNQYIYEENIPNKDLYLMNLEKKEIAKLTNGVSVNNFIWSDDGKKIAAAIAEKNLIDYEYMFTRLKLIEVETKKQTNIVNNPGKLGMFKFNGDASKIAFISAVDTNDSVDGALFVQDLQNPKDFYQLKNYSKDFNGHVIYFDWIDNENILYASEEEVDITLRKLDLTSDKEELILEPGILAFSSFSISDEFLMISGSTPNYPNEVHSFNLKSKKIEKLTNHNQWLNDKNLAKQVKIEYNAKDGLRITGILIYPIDFKEGKKYPLITYIHGGPEAAEINGWQTYYSRWGQVAAGRGYFVFIPNYRASTGRGYKYVLEGFGDLAGKEFDDVIDGIDYLIEKGYVDKNKVGIGGGSYGGYFSAWAATKHSERFAASVCFVGIGNQISKKLTTDIPWEDYYVHWGLWTHENVDLVYDRSPVKWAHQSNTPLLILAGADDPRVHPSQSLELYRAVKLFGKAPVRLVFYPGEGHGNSRNPARLDYALRTMQWFDFYLKGNNKDLMPDNKIDYMVEAGN